MGFIPLPLAVLVRERLPSVAIQELNNRKELVIGTLTLARISYKLLIPLDENTLVVFLTSIKLYFVVVFSKYEFQFFLLFNVLTAYPSGDEFD